MKYILSIVITLLATSAWAGEFYVLEMEDVLLRSSRGQDTIKLKREMQAQYPGVKLRQAELLSVMVVGKTAAGKGNAKLFVGGQTSAAQTIGGNRPAFQSTEETSFDRALFKNPANSSRGKWQVHIRGNFKIRQIVVEIGENSQKQVSLDYRHMHVRTGQGDQDTLFLKAKANQQGLNSNQYEIVSATLYAKSRRGKGSAQLKVGPNMTDSQTIGGMPILFQSQNGYHAIEMKNPSSSSRGVWQIKLRGNIKIEKVVLTVKEK